MFHYALMNYFTATTQRQPMQSILVVQVEDRRSALLDAMMDHNRDICRVNKLGYIKKRGDFSYPPHWRKVFEVQRLMMDPINEPMSWILWIDSDAWIHDIDRLMQLAKKHKKKTMIATRDPPIWSAPFNAGTFLIRNSDSGRQLINEWAALYNPLRWTKTKKQGWSTPGTWAGEDYEQGAFWKHILPDPRWSPKIVMVPWYVLCETNWRGPKKTTAVVHLAGHHKTNLELLFEPKEAAKFCNAFSPKVRTRCRLRP
jgi:hypothetical protein